MVVGDEVEAAAMEAEAAAVEVDAAATEVEAAVVEVEATTMGMGGAAKEAAVYSWGMAADGEALVAGVAFWYRMHMRQGRPSAINPVE